MRLSFEETIETDVWGSEHESPETAGVSSVERSDTAGDSASGEREGRDDSPGPDEPDPRATDREQADPDNGLLSVIPLR